MRLRTRLALSVVMAAVPLAAMTVWARHDLTRRRVSQVLQEFAVTRMESGGRERCEADPARFPPRPRGPAPDRDAPPLPPPPPEVGPMPGTAVAPGDGGPRAPRTRFWAYDSELVSANPHAPPIAPELSAVIRAGDDVALRRLDSDSGPRGYEALVRMAWSDGPCAYVLVSRTGPDLDADPVDAWVPGLIVAGGVLIAVLLASGSVVRRIRRLESEVRRSSEAHYGAPVSVDGDDEVADLARAFDDAASQVREHVAAVETRERALRDFVANTTHDVMTPLTVLAGHLDALRPVVEGTAGAGLEALRDALAEVDYTTSLVANLAAAAKLESGDRALARHPVDLVALVERVAARHRPLARARDVELNEATPDTRVAMLGDVTLLEQAVGNVVQNAVRYNRPQGHVALVLREEGERFELRIVDDGPGVGETEIDRLTQRGFRGSAARTRSETGRGLGLDITREVCERLNLELGFGIAPEGGLQVTIRGARSDV